MLGMVYPYQPIMMPPIPPVGNNTPDLEQRLNNIEKRLSTLENSLNKQNLSSNMMSNYQMI